MTEIHTTAEENCKENVVFYVTRTIFIDIQKAILYTYVCTYSLTMCREKSGHSGLSVNENK